MARRRSGALMPENMASVDPSVGNVSREDRAHGEGRKRIRMTSTDLNLSLPPSITKPGKAYHWFVDDGEGRIQRAKEAFWEHVADPVTGENISRGRYGRTHVLMCIDQKYYDEDEKLRIQEYRATIGENQSIAEKQGGIETTEDETRISKDPFS